jgi:hypothetical protein
MDKTPLVEKQIQEGKLFITKLDEAKLEIKAAFWLYDDAFSSWKLMIASSSEKLNVKKNIIEAYRTLTDIMRAMPDLSIISVSDLTLIPLDHPLIKNIGSLIKTGSDIVDMRYSNSVLNGVYIEGIHIYRMNI